MWSIKLTPVALDDLEKIRSAGLLEKVKELLSIIEQNPYTPPCEKLVGNFKGCYSRRINVKHRLVYRVFKETKTVQIIRLWSHYGD
jgi:Txe/YoeB family toxin of toxin-antitoxin system